MQKCALNSLQTTWVRAANPTERFELGRNKCISLSYCSSLSLAGLWLRLLPACDRRCATERLGQWCGKLRIHLRQGVIGQLEKPAGVRTTGRPIGASTPASDRTYSSVLDFRRGLTVTDGTRAIQLSEAGSPIVWLLNARLTAGFGVIDGVYASWRSSCKGVPLQIRTKFTRGTVTPSPKKVWSKWVTICHLRLRILDFAVGGARCQAAAEICPHVSC